MPQLPLLRTLGFQAQAPSQSGSRIVVLSAAGYSFTRLGTEGGEFGQRSGG